jgi:branched-chain amino acid aminotransferase
MEHTMVWVGDLDGGALVPDTEALISVFDHGFTVGDGVFETIRLTEEGPFALTRHLRRLTQSCAVLGLPQIADDSLRPILWEVWQANRAVVGSAGRMRVTVSAGHGPLGSNRTGTHPTVAVAVAATKPWPPTSSTVVVPWPRNERGALTGVKSTSYAENVLALQYAQDHGADEGIFGNTQGDLCEGTGSNVFIVNDGDVITPPLSSGCLAGVTRSLVLEWFGVREANVTLEELSGAEEVFLTSSTRGIQPVGRLNDRTWSEVGAVARELAQRFKERASADIDPK